MDFIKINADLHIHGLYSAAVSKEMIPKVIATQAPLKGLDVVGTGDILNGRWIKLIKEQLKVLDNGLLEHENGTKFILQTEIEDVNRVHHIILFPEFSKVEEVIEYFKSKCKDLDTEGRPKIRLNGEEIAEVCVKADCLLGPSHMFTPYFGIYSKFNSYKDCYGKYWKDIHFMELGLSADTNMADRIQELHDLTFTSNSDCHSPWPNKLGREFNEILVKEISFEEIKKAIKRESGRKFVLNVKFNPLEGKYHKTRCINCLTFFDPKEAEKLRWRCPSCKKSIKKGADYRIEELASVPSNTHPDHRPKCVYIIPLSEIIALALGIENAWSIKVQLTWKRFIEKFGNEIKILLEIDIKDLKEFDEKIAKYIQYFREEKIKYIPGGAGVYGKLVKPDEELNIKSNTIKQKSLEDF